MPVVTPRIDELLARLRSKLRRQVWLHGLGTAVALGAGWLLFAFLTDRFLHVPATLRIILSTCAIVLPIVLLWRELIRPLQQVPNRNGLAVLAGRAAPETQDVIVSAVQFAQAGDNPQGSAELIQGVITAGEAAAGRVDIRNVLAPKGPNKRAWFGLGAAAVCASALAAQPSMTGIFFARAFGASVPWPRRTNLLVEVPTTGDHAQVEVGIDDIYVRAARGSDVPILIRVEGVLPREVMLRFDGGYESVLPTGGTSLIRTSLRAVQEDLTFTVTGGDDKDDVPRIHLEVLQPPDVTGLAFYVAPPAYTGLEPQLLFDTSIEVLEGSEVRVHVQPDPIECTGVALVSPSNQRLPLEALPFPRNPSIELPASDALESPGLAFDLVADRSLRFSLDLVDAGRLPNPDPGLFSIQVRPDRKPELTMLAPARTEVDVVAGGALPLRVRVGDDFGLDSLKWDVRPSEDLERLLAQGELDLVPYTATGPPPLSNRLRDQRVAVADIEVDALDPETPLVEGRVVLLQVLAKDRREPVPGEAQSAAIRVRVVSADEYLRRLKETLARIGDRTNTLFQLGTSLSSELTELAASYTGDDQGDSPEELGSPAQLSYSTRRLSGDTRTVGRDLTALTEGLLYSRLDPRSGALKQAVGSILAKDAERSFRPQSWLEVTDAYAAGQLGRADLAGDLVELVGLALGTSERHLTQVSAALDRASSAGDLESERAAMEEARAAATRALAELETMLVRLGEFDDLQSVLSSAIEALNRQKSLLQRTKSYAKDQ